MKLNKRVWLSIVPALCISYALVFSSIYHFQKQSYIEQTEITLQLQLSQLSAKFSLYNNFVESYFSSLIKSTVLADVLKLHDDRFRAYAIERNLSSVIDDLGNLDFHSLNLAIIDRQGNIKYFYEDGNDPFAEPEPEIFNITETMFAAKKTDYKNVLIEEDMRKITRAKIINPLTMREPLSNDWDSAIAIILLLDMKSFDDMINELQRRESYQITLSTHHPEIHKNGDSIHANKDFSPLLSAQISYNKARQQKAIDAIQSRLLFIFIALVAGSSFFMMLLISFYIIRPIQRLEKDIVAVESKNKAFPEPSDGDDEINTLARAFANLYRQLRKSYDDTKVLAETDSLTKLHNRRMFKDGVESIISHAKDDEKIALIYIDLDNFKFVNDNYGHESGDILLKEFSQRLSSVVRLTDIVIGPESDLARLAGDEFSVILHEFGSEAMLNKITERILNIFDDGFSCSAGRFPISASIGIAVYPRDGDNAKDLISNADAAMYQAKNGGKNQYAFYSQELADQVRRELQIESALKLKDFSEFTMYYMPIVDANSHQVCSVEALIRWFSASLGFVSPAEFIPIAESRGMFEELDLWVVNRVIDDLPELTRILGEDCKISINISSAQLSSEVFFYQLMQAVQSRDTKRERLELEITETFAAEMSALVESNLNLFKQAGFSLALDDFGAGHTSLMQLINYPIDVIKIDKSLVDCVMGEGQGLVTALIGFCKHQGFSVTAEGVESAEQAEILARSGADSLQGFHFYKPMPLDDLAASIKDPPS